MKYLKIPSLLLMVIAMMTVPAHAGRQVVGAVSEVIGEVKALASGASRTLDQDAPIFLGDRIVTDESGYVKIRLKDETLFTVGPQSDFVVDEFFYRPEAGGGKMEIDFLKGVFRLVTGKITLKKPHRVNVDLPEGTLAIRGTTAAGEVDGFRTLVVLMKSESRFVEPDHVGHLVLSNEVRGVLKETHIQATGYGAMIEGKGFAPTQTFLVSGDDADRLIKKLESSKREVANSEGRVRSVFGQYDSVKRGQTRRTGFRRRAETEEEETLQAEAELIIEETILMDEEASRDLAEVEQVLEIE